MREKLKLREYLMVASMLFGLFFGAGNLIFPVSMGQQAGHSVLWAALGFCATGVGLPLLGIAAMGISESKSLFDLGSRVGKGFAYFFTCALYLTIGPLFAIPRTATVSFQVGVAPMVPEGSRTLALFLFSLVFFAIVLYFSLRPSGILTWVGKLLNPLFLLFMAVLILTAAIRPMGAMTAGDTTGHYADGAFFTGFLEGYNTMDALASLAFGIVLIDVIHGLGVTDPGKTSLCSLKSGFFAMGLMAFVYIATAVIGAQSVSALGVSPDGGTALYLIAKHYFSSVGGFFLGMMITLACLKTSIGLVTACSSTMSALFPKFCSYKVCAVVFSVFSLIVSNAGLSAILSFSLPVLYFLYPLTITLILLGLCGRFFGYRKNVYVSTMTVATIFAVAEGLCSLPGSVAAVLPFVPKLTEVYLRMPLADIGMGWLIPTVLAFLLSRSWKSPKVRK